MSFAELRQKKGSHVGRHPLLGWRLQ